MVHLQSKYQMTWMTSQSKTAWHTECVKVRGNKLNKNNCNFRLLYIILIIYRFIRLDYEWSTFYFVPMSLFTMFTLYLLPIKINRLKLKPSYSRFNSLKQILTIGIHNKDAKNKNFPNIKISDRKERQR